MRKSKVFENDGQEAVVNPLTELLRKGAEQLIFRAVIEVKDVDQAAA